MNNLVLFNNSTRNKLLKKRVGESKFGQHVKVLSSISNIYDQLKNLDVAYVIFGIPEDVGVFANKEKAGTSKAWEASLKVLLNIQNNPFTKANKVLILGHLDFIREKDAISKLNQDKRKDLKKAQELVSYVDKKVAFLVNQIISAGKKPIIVGGGHNNAYGNIKGTSLALNKPINAINFSTRSSFDPIVGRHSNNGFNYAYAEGFLEQYFIFGLHESLISDKQIRTLNRNKNIDYNTFEAIKIKKELKFKTEIEQAKKYIKNSPFGIEINCDAIEPIPSTNKLSYGFNANKTRKFVNHFATHKNAVYLHICDASPIKTNAKKVGKLISNLILDFIKAQK